MQTGCILYLLSYDRLSLRRIVVVHLYSAEAVETFLCVSCIKLIV